MEEKHLIKSTTLQGAVLSAVPLLHLLLKTLGVEVPEGLLEELIVSLVGLIGLVLVFIGRLKASTKLTIK